MSNEAEQQKMALEEALQATSDPVCGFGAEGFCITCSDVALPARVLSVETTTGLALVEVLGTTTKIDVTLVEAAAPGDWLLIHGGVAIARMEESGDG